MKHCCTLYVIVLHAWVCIFAEKTQTHSTTIGYEEQAILQFWLLLSALVIGGELTHHRTSWQGNTMNYHLSAICLCAIFYTVLLRITCNTYAYSFFLHATASIAITIVLDINCTLFTRVMAVFSLFAVTIIIIYTPQKLKVASVGFFVQHQATCFQDTIFEIAHLWGVLGCSVVRSILLLGTVFTKHC